jgi:hypothetical protein
MVASPIDPIFALAGVALVLHCALSVILRALLGWQSPLALELFAATIAIPALLDAKYFVPWNSAPAQMQHQSPLVRVLLLLTRISGAAVPVLLLAFLVVSVNGGMR